jgi:DNA-binding MarR family transcriptional regulator
MGTIRAEIKQRRPFASRAGEGVVTLLRTADHVRAALSAVVEPHGVTLQQYNVLRILRGSGREGLPTLEIGSRMIEASPGITRLLDRLEGKGLVSRLRCPKDRRQVLCHASASALALLSGLDEPMVEAAARVLGSLDDRRTSQLIRLLDAVRGGAAKDAEAAAEETTKTRRTRKGRTR